MEQPLAAGQSPGHSQIGVFSLESRPQTQSHLDSNPNDALAIRSHGSNAASRNVISPLASGSQDGLTLSLSASDDNRPTSFFDLDRSEGASGSLIQSVDAVPDSDFLANASHITGGAVHFHRDNPSDSTNAGLIRSVTHKTRFFGQSHWINIFQTVGKTFHIALFRP